MLATLTPERPESETIYLFDGADNTATYLDLIGTLNKYEYCSFAIAWHGVGQFEIRINRNLPYATDLTAGRIVMLGKSANRWVGVITDYSEAFDKDGKSTEIITAKGEELKTLFGRRLVVPPAGLPRFLLTDQAETCIKELVKAQCGSTASANRKICGRSVKGDSFQIDTDTSSGADYTVSARESNLRDELDMISIATGIGYWLELDATTKKVKLFTSAGVDRVATQSVNTRAIFKKEWNTAASGNYQYTDGEYKNHAYVGGEGTGINRTIREVYDTTEKTGSDRREVFVDARDLLTTGELDAKGTQVLGELSFTEYLDIIALTNSSIEYGVEYNLGDIVTVEGFGGSFDTRIIQVARVLEEGRDEYELTFDKRAPTLPRIMAKGKRQEAYTAASVEIPTTTETITNITEANTWTPTLFGTNTAGTPTYTTNAGWYRKIGRVVFIFGRIVMTNKGGMAGPINIGGLPYTSQNTGAFRAHIGISGHSGITFTAGYTSMAGQIVNNTQAISFQQNGSNVGAATIDDAAFANATVVNFSGVYISTT